MKELHNHIFSNTTCISKETMLRYINKQLSKKELHEVEKHMLDCELCSEAFEGMKLAQNSSMLFAIDNLIDQRVRGGAKKSPIIKNLMVAASVLVIVFGAYFTFNTFNNTLNEEAGLAVNEKISDEELKATPENFIIEEEPIEVDEVSAEEQPSLSFVEEVESEEEQNQSNSERTEPDFYRTTTVSGEKSEDDVADVTVLEDAENIVYDEIDLAPVTESTTAVAEEAAMDLDVVNNKDVTSGNRVDNNVAGNTRQEDKKKGALKKEMVAPKTKNDEQSKSSKRKYKENRSNAPASPAFESEGNLTQATISGKVERQQTYTLYTYKVYDYTEEYQNEYDFKRAAEVKTVTPDFANEEDKELAEKELEKSTIEVTYKESLDLGIKELKAAHYQLALVQFNLILKAHPTDVNALFYSGICQYNLKQYELSKTALNKAISNTVNVFDEEAKWYRALCIVATDSKEKAKKALNEIIQANGFYKDQAKAKLKALK